MTKSLFNQGETLLSLSSALSDISALMDRETCAHTRTHTDRPTTITLAHTGEGSGHLRLQLLNLQTHVSHMTLSPNT